MTERTRPRACDVIVIGGGPAGCAAAITAQRSGARVVLLERDVVARDRPGETLHPGVESLLARLGAGQLLADAALARHEGHWVQAFGPRRYEAFGSDAGGAWRGFQVWRSKLDSLLRQHAADLGVSVRRGTVARSILRAADGRVRGVTSGDCATATAGVVIDASGGTHWLARMLRLGVTRLSPRYVANFGYVSANHGSARRDLPAEPLLRAERDGWTWIAPLGPRGWHWTRLSFAAQRMAREWCPPELRGMAVAPSRGADVTWRMAQSVAGPGWLIVGDAAAVLDPASSHGVLRALMSGAKAGVIAAQSCDDPACARAAFAEFDAWLRAGVLKDAGTLKSHYAEWGCAAVQTA